MTHVTLRPEFEDLIDPYAPVGQVGTGFDFTEGPIWHPVDHYLLFSDMPGDVRRRWDARRGVVEVKRPSNKCNGMTYDAELNLIVCEHATSSPDPRAARRTARGARLAFREPGAQQPERCLRAFRAARSISAIPGMGACRSMASSGRASSASRASIASRPAAARRSSWSTAICSISRTACASRPTSALLYVNDTVQALIRVFDVEADGSLANARVFASGIRSELEPGVPDGMKCDQRGNVWVTAPGGVWVYSPAGELLGKVRVPELVANLAWGGADFRTLYLTATHSVYAIPTKVGPRHEPYMSGRRVGRSGAAPAAPRRAATGRRRHAARSAALRDDHPGPAERRDHGRRRVRRFRRARPCARAAGGRQCPPPCGGRAGARRRHHPCLVRRRAGRARRHAQCAAVRGAGRQQGAWCAEAGARRRFRGSSRAPAISSSRRCA